MKSLFISGMAGSGKTAIALGLALKLREEGIKVGYFKPLDPTRGSQNKSDDDVRLLKQVLNLPHDESVLSPVHTGPFQLSWGSNLETSTYRKKIMEAYEQVSVGVDTVIVDGSLSPYTAASVGLDAISLAKMLSSAMVYVVRLTDDYSFDKTVFHNEHFRLAGLPMLGNIFNNVSRTLLDKTKGVYTPILEKLGYPVFGVIPQKAEIAAPTVREYYDSLGGELLAGDESKMMRLVEEVVIGSMTIEGALSYLRRAPNKAVITGGDRSDIAITALETSTSVLILTGGLYPDVSVISKATEKKVPVILVHYDTYTAIERLHEVSRRIHPSDTHAVQIAQDNISEYCNWKSILEYVKS
ncbi:MAG TPA: phosphotransacetylase family protein [Oscillospiraceae bacterium]|nr:phosphotransacetylase family protein [Oscillospiraceae bacterium]